MEPLLHTTMPRTSTSPSSTAKASIPASSPNPLFANLKVLLISILVIFDPFSSFLAKGKISLFDNFIGNWIDFFIFS